VLWGAADPVLPVSTGESVQRDLGAGCVMVTVPGAGHFVVEEAPDVVAEVLLDFLADERVPEPAVAAAPPEKAAEEHTPLEPPPAVLQDPPLEAPATGVPAKRAPAKKAAAKKAAATKAPAKKAPGKRIPPSTGA
jgi:hypothetical protein